MDDGHPDGGWLYHDHTQGYPWDAYNIVMQCWALEGAEEALAAMGPTAGLRPDVASAMADLLA
eukprot:gene13843-8863_t